MNNSIVPLQGELLLATQLELVTPTTMAGTFYGVAFTLFCLYVHSLVPQLQDEDRKRRAKFMFGYTVVIMLCGLYDLVANTWIIQDAYIKHGDYFGGPYLYLQSSFHTGVMAVMSVCQMAVDILTSTIQAKIWRVWVIWSATRYAKLVIVLPSLCILVFAVLTLKTIILATTLSVAENIRLGTKTQLVQQAIQVVITILCTMLISLYLVYQHLWQRNLLGKANGSAGYLKIVAMLIESYSLESIWILMRVILYPHLVSVAFLEGGTYIQIIAYLLVQYRVASGKAYESQRGRRTVSSLRWNHSNHATTTQVANLEINETDGGPHMSESTKREGSEALPVISMA
ncbi:hypothetical protein AGABI1DRAFT_131811 [Agaricus bisporus var. burnettii JB137-S8]|uniref:Uncharacterized protein n=1 Tax=Agaricus bisporus var. burnettii (strain JB137-S8 / ATCC MYA-4627 / FGSC 10392) TaxID=597362 RepID=K5WZ63_AGABU|nr:uncharacterized protein AGABI1DRAFT_131811 [Agaricus bisporus var. burnettii JB137-S8]EKM75912.1 hypothetical protein AGABI1DRAFT_131811 [Agaricus bisporus var. burnettii JB137-S8]